VLLAAVVSSVAPGTGGPVSAGEKEDVMDSAAERFAALALSCVHREYPNKIGHVLSSDGDVKPPRALTPVFYGCFDWHSAVHGHWLLVRLARKFPDGKFVEAARQALDASFRAEKVAVELEYLRGEGRQSFERPYGLAWFLQLCAELNEWEDPDARRWAKLLEPLESEVEQRFLVWLPKLSHPIRTGEHSQSAFAMGLVLDWARSRGRDDLAELVEARARAFYLDDRGWSLAFEPSGQDFLSPGLAEADLMRRVLEPPVFARWLTGLLPGIPAGGAADWLPPAVVTDKSDGKLAHLDGLNLARAWMIEGIREGLPRDDPRCASLDAAARTHRGAGLEAVTGEHYEGGHWLGSFAVYLVTRRGLAVERDGRRDEGRSSRQG